MSHSLRAKIKCLRYKGIITDKDCDRLRKALDNENVIEDIKAEIKDNILDEPVEYTTNSEMCAYNGGLLKALTIIDKYKAESESI